MAPWSFKCETSNCHDVTHEDSSLTGRTRGTFQAEVWQTTPGCDGDDNASLASNNNTMIEQRHWPETPRNTIPPRPPLSGNSAATVPRAIISYRIPSPSSPPLYNLSAPLYRTGSSTTVATEDSTDYGARSNFRSGPVYNPVAIPRERKHSSTSAMYGQSSTYNGVQNARYIPASTCTTARAQVADLRISGTPRGRPMHRAAEIDMRYQPAAASPTRHLEVGTLYNDSGKKRAQSLPPRILDSLLPQISTCAPRRDQSAAKNRQARQVSNSSDQTSPVSLTSINSSNFNKENGNRSEPDSDSDDETARQGVANSPSDATPKSFPCLDMMHRSDVPPNHTARFKYISELVRHMISHGFFACDRCMICFETKSDGAEHKRLPHLKCIKQGCKRHKVVCGNGAELGMGMSFRCHSCLLDERSRFNELLFLKNMRDPRPSNGLITTFPANPESDSGNDVIMNGQFVDGSFERPSHHADDTLYQPRPMQFGPMPMHGNESLPSTITRAQIEGTSAKQRVNGHQSNSQRRNMTHFDEPEEIASPSHQEHQDVDSLNEQLRQETERSNILEATLSAVWKSLKQENYKRTAPGTRLHGLMKVAAPQLIESAETDIQATFGTTHRGNRRWSPNIAADMTVGWVDGQQRGGSFSEPNVDILDFINFDGDMPSM